MTFEEAGLLTAPAREEPRVSPLSRATRALLDAIERDTGERPVFDDEEEAFEASQPAPDAVRRAEGGWRIERTELAVELLRQLEHGGAPRSEVERARAALRWDWTLGARWSEVDWRLVSRALREADTALGPELPVAQAELVPSGPEFVWPVDPVRLTSRFGLRSDPFGGGVRRHVGIDLAAVVGQHVFAAAPGSVVFAGWRGGYGRHVEVRHEDGFVSRYSHLHEIEVRRGEQVTAGTVLGRAGQTGRATGPHLHFELWRHGMPIDPQDELPSATLRLTKASD